MLKMKYLKIVSFLFLFIKYSYISLFSDFSQSFICYNGVLSRVFTIFLLSMILGSFPFQANKVSIIYFFLEYHLCLIIYHLMTGMCFDICIVRWFNHCVNILDATYTNLNGTVYYTLRLCSVPLMVCVVRCYWNAIMRHTTVFA